MVDGVGPRCVAFMHVSSLLLVNNLDQMTLVKIIDQNGKGVEHVVVNNLDQMTLVKIIDQNGKGALVKDY